MQALRRIGPSGASLRPLLNSGTLGARRPPLGVQAKRYGLFQPFNSGRRLGTRQTNPGGLREYLCLARSRDWCSSALPPLFKRARPFAVVTTLQLAFYFYVYFSAPVDTRYYVISSFPRLSLQLIPAVLAVAFGSLGDDGELEESVEAGRVKLK